MAKEDLLRIALALQEIALSLDDETLAKVKDKLKQIENIVLKEA